MDSRTKKSPRKIEGVQTHGRGTRPCTPPTTHFNLTQKHPQNIKLIGEVNYLTHQTHRHTPSSKYAINQGSEVNFSNYNNKLFSLTILGINHLITKGRDSFFQNINKLINYTFLGNNNFEGAKRRTMSRYTKYVRFKYFPLITVDC